MRYTIKLDQWCEDTQAPARYIDTNNIAYDGDSASEAQAAYHAASVALFNGGTYRTNVGVFFYTAGKLTDRFLMSDGRRVQTVKSF